MQVFVYNTLTLDTGDKNIYGKPTSKCDPTQCKSVKKFKSQCLDPGQPVHNISFPLRSDMKYYIGILSIHYMIMKFIKFSIVH